jgi:uncharacterized protein YmfQ (DUF2313 family)
MQTLHYKVWSVSNCYHAVLLNQSPAHSGSSLEVFSTLNKEAIRSSETSVHTRSIRRLIPEDGILDWNNFYCIAEIILCHANCQLRKLRRAEKSMLVPGEHKPWLTCTAERLSVYIRLMDVVTHNARSEAATGQDATACCMYPAENTDNEKYT